MKFQSDIQITTCKPQTPCSTPKTTTPTKSNTVTTSQGSILSCITRTPPRKTRISLIRIKRTFCTRTIAAKSNIIDSSMKIIGTYSCLSNHWRGSKRLSCTIRTIKCNLTVEFQICRNLREMSLITLCSYMRLMAMSRKIAMDRGARGH